MIRTFIRNISYKPQPQLFIHELPSLNRAKLSFHENPNKLEVGIINNVQGKSLENLKISPKDFEENKEFLSKLQEIIKNNIQNDFAFIVEAGAYPSSHLPIYDFRLPPSHGRIPEVENVFGYVKVSDDGVIEPGSYQSNNMYRLLSGTDGPINLSDYLLEQIQNS
ncbi:hypothetical protein LJB42_003612 [Komagataella kurtzmanii]|nr:hypothetical protein LJB42_003612 [Komagataella kurtzmanii]